MRSPRCWIILGALLLSGARCAWAQEQSSTPGARVVVPLIRLLQDTSFQLPHQFIQSGSDSVRLSTGKALLRDREYRIDYRFGVFRLLLGDTSLVRVAGADTSLGVTITFRYLPFDFQRSYFRRIPPREETTVPPDSMRIVRRQPNMRMEDLFGPGLQKSGSIFRGFTVASNRDATLTSGLRLQMSGRIAEDVDVNASLTDENTPIQPEGTTETLQEFDKVFVEIKSPSLGATLGDFNLDLGHSLFANVTRKLQGASVKGETAMGEIATSAVIAGASTRGKFHTLSFLGSEGVQGPYRLTGRSGETSLIVIAGSEHVYVDGELQRRGETNEYVIDYGTAEVRFTVRRLITAASRIVIDFEYTDRQYARSLFAARADGSAGSTHLGVMFVREADNPDAPIDLALTDSTRRILAAAGGDRSKAFISGITRVDSNGVYAQIDTVLPGEVTTTFYRYAPGDSAAHYTVRFSSVGSGNGEYIRREFGVFEWRGPHGGEYLPVVLLPFPEEHRLFGVTFSSAPLAGLSLEGELAGSSFEANRFSTDASSQSTGTGYDLSLRYQPQKMRIGTIALGNADVRVHERYLSAAFLPFDRTNEVEFTRKWGVDSLARGDERTREISLGITPVVPLTVRSDYGHFSRGGVQSSDRIEGGIQWADSSSPRVDYDVESVHSSDDLLRTSSRWLRQRGNLEYRLAGVRPYIRYEGEDRRLTVDSTGNDVAGSLRFTSLTGGIAAQNIDRLSLGAEFGWRNDHAFDGVRVAPQSTSTTQSYSARFGEWENLSSSFDLTLRRRVFEQSFHEIGNQDIRTVLIRSHERYTPMKKAVDLDLNYEVLTEQASKQERIYLKVSPGTGNYRYLGDLNNNGQADEEEFVQTRFDGDYVARTLAVGELVPIIDLRTGARLRLQPQRLLSVPSTGWEAVLSALSSETTVRVEEKSATSRLADVYLFKPSALQQEATTITGATSILQDLLILDGNQAFSARLRFQQRKGLTTLVNGPERTFTRERSVRLRFQLIPEVASQWEFVNRADRLEGRLSPRQRDIGGNAVSADFSYRPEQEVECGMRLDVSRATDRLPAVPAVADINAQTLRLVYAFAGRGQLRAETSREEARVSGANEQDVSYELTGGRVSGVTWLWRLGFDYRVTGFLQTTIAYDGRREGATPPVHTARAEVRAFF